jgi:hypothetical protein
VNVHIVAYLLKARTVEPEKQSLRGNGCVTRNSGIVGIGVFCAFRAEDQLPLLQSPETAVKRVGGLCEMAVSLRGRQRGSRRTSTVRSRYQAAQ